MAMTSAASANSTGKRGEQTGRLDEMSAGSMSLPELLQEPLILRPRSDLRTFWANVRDGVDAGLSVAMHTRIPASRSTPAVALQLSLSETLYVRIP
jgi:hypothetical protein